MDEAIKALDANNLEKAKEKVEQGKSLIAERIKLIKIEKRTCGK